MPRFLSAVTTLASSLPTDCTQTCRTSFLSGARNARRLPSGETCGDALVGLPNSTLRGISGGSSARAGGGGSSSAASDDANTAERNIAASNVERDYWGEKGR